MPDFSFSVAIMAVPERSANAHKLALQTGGTVFMDTRKLGCWANAQKCWSMAREKPYHLVLQDDTELITDFMETLELLLTLNSNQVISLWSGRFNKEYGQKALKAHSAWYVLTHTLAGVAVLMPSRWWLESLRWQEGHVRPEVKHDDARMRCFLNAKEISTWFTVPELVSHQGVGISLMGHNHSNQTDINYPGKDFFGTKVDWTCGLSSPPTFRVGFGTDKQFLLRR